MPGAGRLAFFWAGEGAFDTAGMHRETESRGDLVRQGPGGNGAVGAPTLVDQRHDRGRQFVRTFRAPRFGQQSGQALVGERGLGLVVGRTRQPKQRGGLGFGGPRESRVAQHLVLDLEQIARIEEVARLEPGGPNGSGTGVEQAGSTQAFGLGIGLGHGRPHAGGDTLLHRPLGKGCQEKLISYDRLGSTGKTLSG